MSSEKPSLHCEGCSLRAILEALPDAVVVAGADERIVYVNAVAEQLLGWPKDEIVGEQLSIIIPERMRHACQLGFRRYIDTQRSRLHGRSIRVHALHKSGREIEVELTLAGPSSISSESLVIASIRDLRPRVDLERQLALTRNLKAVTLGAARMAERLDFQHVVDTAVNSLVEGFDAALVRIWLLEPDERHLSLCASGGTPTEIETSKRRRIDLDTYPYKVGEVARTRVPFIKNGLGGDPLFEQDFIEREKIVSVAAYPLFMVEELSGVLVCFFRHALEEEVIEALQTFVTILSSSLKSVRLFEREQAARSAARRAEKHQAFISQVTTRLAGSLELDVRLDSLAKIMVPELADWCAIDMYDGVTELRHVVLEAANDEKRAQVRERRLSDPNMLLEPHGPLQVLRTGEAELLPSIDEELAKHPEVGFLRSVADCGLSSAMVVPISAYGRTLGVICLGLERGQRRYDEGDLALAKELVDRAGLAIDNARLYAEAKEAIRVRDEFLTIASHELKTPLTSMLLGIQGMIRSIARSAGGVLDTERIMGKLSLVERQGQRLSKLVTELLDISRITGERLSLDREELDLVELTYEIVTRFSDELGKLGCELHFHATGSVVGRWDRSRIDQVLTNLLSNAMKFGQGKPIEMAVAALGERARFSVRDHGIGIAHEDKERIFQRFERAVSSRHYGGFGMGLWIVREIIEAHGGSIHVESTMGEGSNFIVELPMREVADDS